MIGANLLRKLALRSVIGAVGVAIAAISNAQGLANQLIAPVTGNGASQLSGSDGSLQRGLPERVRRQLDDSEREERELDKPQIAEELDVVPQPFYERFSSFIRMTTGKRVQGALPYSKVGLNNIKLPDSYTVSNGDQIEIQVWGSVNLSYTVRVDGTGRVFIPEVGSFQVQGVRNSDLTGILTKQFQRIYRGFELRALVSSARSVDMMVTGQAHVIGLRSVPSSVSFVGAALAFTRPTEGGSRRFIELRRGSTIQRVDLYCFSHGRCGNLPTTLQDNDALHVPSRGKLVAISGAVNRPGIYELADGEGISDLLGFAGGLSIDHSSDPVDLYSFQMSDGLTRDRGYQRLKLQDICAGRERSTDCRMLQDGDYLDLRPVVTTVKGMVTITAAGTDPVRVKYEPGMRLIDVLRQQPMTRFLSIDTIMGVNRGEFRAINELDERLPEIDLESVTLYRLKGDSRGYESISANAQAALSEGASSEHNVLIEDGDILALDTKAAWKSPRASLSTTVRLLGEVGRPGRYRFTGVRTLKELLDQAGGITADAAVWGAVILRMDDSRASLNRRTGVNTLQSVIAYQARVEALNFTSETPDRLAEAAAAARVNTPNLAPAAVEMNRLIGNRSVIYLDSVESSSLTLVPGDVVIIPPKQETIGCYGAVFRQGEISLGGAKSSAANVRSRCGIVEEMSPTVYHFSVRGGGICREGWFSKCPDLAGGDFIVAVPDAVRKRGTAAFLEYLEGFYKAALSLATLKILSQ